jgi:hypothetical protein
MPKANIGRSGPIGREVRKNVDPLAALIAYAATELGAP